MCSRAAALSLLSLVAYFAAGAGCEGTASTPYDDVGQWLCYATDASCTCYGGPAGSKPSAPDKQASPTASCDAALDCCFVKDNLDGTFTCSCVPTPPDEPGSSAGAGGEGGAATTTPASRCLIAAAEHGTPTVTPHCPPVTLDRSAVCALTFESCEPTFLKKNGLVACCDGLVCQPDANGQKLCVQTP